MSQGQKPTAPTTSPRWYQVRLRSLLIGVSTIAIVLAVFAVYIRPYLAQTSFRAQITATGGTVETRPGPSWLQAVLGKDKCQDITLVNLGDIDPDEQLLARVSALPELEILVLGGEGITDDSLRYVPTCETLQGVIFDSTYVTEAALDRLRAQRPGVYIGRCDRRIADDLRTAAGHIVYDQTVEGNPPDHIKQRLHAGYFDLIRAINTERIGDWFHFGSREIAQLPRLSQLEVLELDDWDAMILGDFFESGDGIYTSMLKTVFSLPQLRRLKVVVKGDGWKDHVVTVPHLEELTVYPSGEWEPLTDADVCLLLEHYPQLKSFSMPWSAVTDPGTWPQRDLESLNLSDSPIDDEDLRTIVARFPGLRSLNLEMTEVTDAGIVHLQALEHLEELLLAGTRVTHASGEALRGLSSLRRISIGMRPPEHVHFFSFSREFQPNQQVFGIDAEPREFDPSELELATAREAETRQRLELLNPSAYMLGLGPYVDYGATPIESLLLDSLCYRDDRVVDFSDTYLDDTGLAHLRAFRDVAELNLQNTWLTDAGMSALARLNTLRILSLAGTRVTSTGLAELTSLENLQSLTLPPAVAGDCVDILLKLPSLRYVCCSNEHWAYWSSRRKYLTKELTAQDVQQFRRLAKVLFPRADLDGDGVLQENEIDAMRGGLADFPSVPSTNARSLRYTRGKVDESIFLRAMLAHCRLSAQAEEELQRSH